MTLPGAAPRPVDWPRVDRALCEMYHMTPAEVDALTYSEIAVMLMDGRGRAPSGVRQMSDQEIVAEARRWRALTPAQRLEDARRQRDG